VHLLERPAANWDSLRRGRALALERDADALALELLAPDDMARACVAGLEPGEMPARLSKVFGLPGPRAADLARIALSDLESGASHWLTGERLRST
jgi:hypothetical protein